MRKHLFIALASVGAFIALSAGNALAATQHHSTAQALSLYRPFPEGIDPNNAQHALQQVMDRASWDDQYVQVLAQQTGATSFDPTQYVTLGYKPHAPAGTTNSALTGSGTVVPVADHGGSQFVKVMVVMNISTKKTVALMVRCGNPRLHPFVRVIPWKPFQKGTVIIINRSVNKPVSITCPSGQTVSGTITATVHGTFKARTWGKVQGNLNLQLQGQVDLQVKAFVTLRCGPAPIPPTPPTPPAPAPQPPAQVFSATATATASASATCPDGTTATATSSGSGSATSTVSQADAQQKASAAAFANASAAAAAAVKCGSAPPPVTPPVVIPAPSVTITSTTTLNDIPTGKTSGPFNYTVNASAPGTFTVDPGVGGVSDCNSSTPTGSFQANLAAGNNSFCVIFYAPSDSAVTSMTITATAIVSTAGGTAKDVKPQTFGITYPVRPLSFTTDTVNSNELQGNL